MTSQSPPSTTSGRSSRHRVALSLVGLLVLAAVAELLLQELVPQLGMRRYDARYTGSHPREVNERGFRGVIPSPDRSDLVLCLGDSTTFGTGVAVADTWPSRLEATSVAGDRFVGINAARQGADLNQLIRSLDEIWTDFRPRAIAIAISGNMVSLAWIRREISRSLDRPASGEVASAPLSLRQRLRYLPSDSALVGGVLWLAETFGFGLGVIHHRIEASAPFGGVLAYGWTQGGLDPTLADQAWAELASDLKTLRDWCDERDVQLVATWIPTRFSVSNDVRDNLKFVPLERLTIDANARCREICESLSIPFGDSLASMRSLRQRVESAGGEVPLYVFGDYVHPDASGHAAVAEAVGAVLATQPRDASDAPK